MRRRRRGCLRQILAIPIILALAFGFLYLADALLFAPWAYGLFGRPTLTGDWTGTLRNERDTPFVLYLHLSRSETALTGRLAPDINGLMAWCAPGVPSTTRPIQGTSDRSASDVKLDTDVSAHLRRGLIPAHFEGAWHDPTLSLHVLFTFNTGHGFLSSDTIPNEHRPADLTLRKGGIAAYRSTCARLRGP